MLIFFFYLITRIESTKTHGCTYAKCTFGGTTCPPEQRVIVDVCWCGRSWYSHEYWTSRGFFPVEDTPVYNSLEEKRPSIINK